MENIRLWFISAFLFLWTIFCFSQDNKSHIVSSPSKDLKIILLSHGKPIMEGSIVIKENKMINHGMFIVYRQDGTVKETILYNMGDIIEIVKFEKQDKI